MTEVKEKKKCQDYFNEIYKTLMKNKFIDEKDDEEKNKISIQNL